MRAKRTFELLLVAVVLGLLVLPTANMVRPFIPQSPLNGVVEPIPRPPFRIADALSEEFQRGFTRWFDQRYGARPMAARLDNTTNYYVFRELRPEHVVKVGGERVLFLNEQIGHYNRYEVSRAGIDHFARKVREAQDLVAAQGKYLVVILIPSKVAFEPEAIPRDWTLPVPEPRPCVEAHDAMVTAFERERASFVDGWSVLQREIPAKERETIYSPTGRHMNAHAVCKLLEAALDLARPRVRNATIPMIDCAYEMVHAGDVAAEEFDLFRLLNVWGPPPRVLVPQMFPVPERVPENERADTLVVGSSFAWRPMFEAERNHALGHIHLFYYNKTVVDRDGRPFYPVPPVKSEAWQRLVLDKKLYLLPTIEEFVPFDNLSFLDDLVEGIRE